MKINRNYLNLNESYLFSTVSKRVNQYKEKHPGRRVISLGIGDVTLPLCDAAVNAMKQAALDMGTSEGFKGYGPEQGYDFLKSAISRHYAQRGVSLDLNEIFVSDGAKSDLANFLDILDIENTVQIPDPVYPVYVDSNIMAGRPILYMDATESNGFLPMPGPGPAGGIIYLCSPNNPTGAAYSKEQLSLWVRYARENDAVILFDAAYEAYIKDGSLPRSIYEIEGAKCCAVEFCSLSKTAGFTGVRCGYTIVPKELKYEGAALNSLWLRRQTTKFNGVSYIVQRGAEAVFTRDGQAQTMKSILYYMENAGIIARALNKLGAWFAGGENSPYIWLKCPKGMTSWMYFDYLLENANVIVTPGSGFGKNGEGFIRLTSFGERQSAIEAMERLSNL